MIMSCESISVILWFLTISTSANNKFKKKCNENKEDRIITAQYTSTSGIPKWRQSPVDLTKINTWEKKFPPLLLNSYWLNEGEATLTNTGRTVKVELSGNRKTPYLKGGPFRDSEYEFSNMQFRWGPNNACGAEHSIDNQWNSMEAQAIHWNTQYGSIEKCYDKPDGIAILSYLMQVVGCPGIPDNPVLARVTGYLPDVRKMGTSVKIPPDCLWWMAEACRAPGYYTYAGSLTVPPYHECVTWIVFPRPINLSARQMDHFRSIFDNKWEAIVSNYRGQQCLHGRRILFANDCAVA